MILTTTSIVQVFDLTAIGYAQVIKVFVYIMHKLDKDDEFKDYAFHRHSCTQ